jgi:NTP pyrophosphatase (non-canonical NTP hydrolase)
MKTKFKVLVQDPTKNNAISFCSVEATNFTNAVIEASIFGVENVLGVLPQLKNFDIVSDVVSEVIRATEKHPKFVANLSDGALVIAEEGGEVADAVLKYFYEGGNYSNIEKEVIHVAATAFRLLEYINNNPVPERINSND